MRSEFEKLINENGGRIRAIARRYSSPEAEEDLYQEILEQLWRSFAGFNRQSKPETWIYRVGFNTAMTGMRKTIRRRDGETKLKGLKQTEETSGERSPADILEDFVGTLNDVDTSVLVMYLDGLSGQEMADVLGVNLNAIQVRVSRLKKMFSDRYLEVE